MDPAALAALESRARFDNVDASLRIEGFYLDAARVRELIDGAQPSGDTEAQAAGYAEALRVVESVAATSDAADEGSAAATATETGPADVRGVSAATIVALYETIFSHRDLGRKSRYRTKDYAYVQVDGKPRAMPASPVAAFEAPLVLGGACDGLAEALLANAVSPLVLNAVFTIDFLCIHPFDEGNGRVSRLFSELMLGRAGFDVFRYESIDRAIERSGMAYYDALNACVEGWDRSANDYAPYVRYWIDVVHSAYERLFARIDSARDAGRGKADRVRAFVVQADRPVTKREIRAALPDVSEATVEAALGAMVKESAVEKFGASRVTAYRASARPDD